MGCIGLHGAKAKARARARVMLGARVRSDERADVGEEDERSYHKAQVDL